MKKNRAKLRNMWVWFFPLFMILFVSAIFSVKAQESDVPAPDVIYNSDNNWVGTLEINTSKTVKISGVTHSNQGTSYGSAIKICGNSVVNLVFEGDNVLEGNSGVTSAGIEVEEGSTVNIYGLEGSSLRVTGGKNSAGIGGIGYGSVGATNPKAGNVVIYSGNITAIGGEKGAGIGSGYHSSASDIKIKGGNIIALGSGSGAGIGSGYGTSGGSATAAGVGFYNGGNITISGGTVKAAAYHINFDNFDPYNVETLYGDGYSNTHAAGIGGGYGASSGNIIIEGDADVTAIGASGGAGIGSGRGTSKPANYDAANFNVDITIRGNSKVIAMATNDTRSGQTAEGGAAIGLGRGCTIEGNPKGSVKIEGNANVYAVGPYYAQAIGGSRTVGSTVIDAHLASIDLGSATLVMAISDGQREAIDYVNESDISDFLNLNFSDEYFENRSDFFTEDKFPLNIAAIDFDNSDAITTFSIPSPKKQNFMVHVRGAKKYNFVVEDYKGESGETIFISNGVEENTSEFFPDLTKIKRYDAMGLTARLDRDDVIEDAKYGKLNLNVRAREGIFDYGSTFFCDIITDKTIIDELYSKIDKKYTDKLERILYFNIGAKDRSGEEYSEIKGGKIRIYVQLPEGWDKKDVRALFIRSLNGGDFSDSMKIEVIDGITYLSFETDHFGDYVLFDPVKKKPDDNDSDKEDNGEYEDEYKYEDEGIDGTTARFFLTGDNIYIISTALIVLFLIVSLILVLTMPKKYGKKFKK